MIHILCTGYKPDPPWAHWETKFFTALEDGPIQYWWHRIPTAGLKPLARPSKIDIFVFYVESEIRRHLQTEILGQVVGLKAHPLLLEEESNRDLIAVVDDEGKLEIAASTLRRVTLELFKAFIQEHRIGKE